VTNYEVSVSTSRGIRDLKVSGIMKNDNIYISADDITDMKKLTYSLEHSRMNYQNMFNSIDEFIFILNSNGEIIYSNRAVNEKTGYSVSDLRNIRFSGIVLDKNVNELEEDLVEILNGERVDSHLTFQTKDKKGIPTHAKAWLSKWNDGDVIFVFAKDLSTEQELLIRFNKLFYSNPNYLTLHDYQDEKILEVNETFLKTFGFTKEEVIGKTFKDIGLQSLVKSSSLKSYLTSIKTTHEETYFDGIKNINLLHYIELIESNTANYLLSELIDVTELTKAKEQVQYYSSFQDILMKLATEFINVPLDKVTNTINKALEMMGKFIDTDRVYIFDYNFEKGTTSNLYEWCNDNIEPQIEVLQDVPLESIASWVNRHLLGETIHITNVSNLSNDDKVRVILESQNIKSVLTVPMMLSDTCVGFAGFDSVRTEKIYTDEELDLLHLFTQMIVNILNREQQEKLLIAKINEREILVNEIHHRVKNNLQIVSSLLYLQTLHTDSKKVKKILQGSINRLKAMALLHDRIYKGDDLGDFNFKEYVIGINKQLFDYYTIGKDIKLIMDIDNIRININKAVPVGLMINELVTNAVQHAFIDRQTGMLSIRVKEEEECLILEIADNGIGINISLDELKIKSLGMQIVDSLVNQLSGTMILEVNNGTKFTIKLPKANLS
jgi:PAS domain S-box-containing protein